MILGIDLGTTNSLVGIYEAGMPLLLADEDGRRLMPSSIYFPLDGSNPVVGCPALRMRGLAPERTLVGVKRLIGRRFDEVDPACFPFTVVKAEDGWASILIDGRKWLPEEISALVLARLKAIAETRLETSIGRAVITVPAYFNHAQREKTKKAGELAGLDVERIFAEPTAAALAYGLDRLPDHAHVAVFDFGGGTFDVSILELSKDKGKGVFEVLSTNGDTLLGGHDLDVVLANWIRRELELELSSVEVTSRLLEIAEAARIRLSDWEETDISLPFIQGASSVGCRLTRAELEVLCLPIIEKTRALCLRALHDAGLSREDLDEVILVGGVTRMPLIRRFVAEVFGREPNTSQNPDEAVALGATFQAGILSGALKHLTLLDVTPLSLGIETFGGLMNVIIPRNTTIPCKKGEMFTNAVSGQATMRISVLQGEREMARDNWKLGEFDVPFELAPRGQARVGVQFEIDANGILTVLARDIATNKDTRIEIKSVVDVADSAVEKMISDSVEHAFDDMNERVFAEARLKAEELLAAVEVTFAQLGNEVSCEEQTTIQALTIELRKAIAEKNAARLKTLVADLDKLTEPLAMRFLSRFIEEG